MTKYFYISSLLILASLFVDCSGNKEQKPEVKPDNKPKPKSQIIPKPIELDLSISKQTDNEKINYKIELESFLDVVLKGSQRLHKKEYFENRDVYHMNIFDKKGLSNYFAYSDKRRSNNTRPTYYENFVLFVLEYDSDIAASNSFQTVFSNSKLSEKEIDSLRTNNYKLLASIDTSLKPGGLICLRNNFIFSLVKTCRKPPIDMSWGAYEELFIKSIINKNEEVNSLSADCGNVNYTFEKRKPAQ